MAPGHLPHRGPIERRERGAFRYAPIELGVIGRRGERLMPPRKVRRGHVENATTSSKASSAAAADDDEPSRMSQV
jgi:hypothetical protein